MGSTFLPPKNSVEDVVRDGPVDFESALVLRKFILVHHEGEGPKPHRVGVARELHPIDRREPGLEGGASEVEAPELERRDTQEVGDARRAEASTLRLRVREGLGEDTSRGDRPVRASGRCQRD